MLLSIYPLRANDTHATTPYGIGTCHNNRLRKNGATTSTSNKFTKLRIPITKDKRWTVKYRNST